MTSPVSTTRRRLAGLLLVASLVGCSKKGGASRQSFVGKWKSSRLLTSLHLYENGEWEILQDDGSVLQYGIWEYTGNSILWTYKVDGKVGHDMNVILAVSPREFQLREEDGSTTIFARLD